MNREQCLDEAAQILVDARARRDAMTPDEAARVALPHGTPAEVLALAGRIAAHRRRTAA